MIAWFWLLPAAWIGAAVGYFTAALMVAARRGEVDLTPRPKQ